MRRSTTRRFAAWLAILAMGLNGLWPLLANAAPVEFVAPVCSMVGTTIAVDAGGMPAQPAPAKSPAPHCPYCSFGSDHSAALPGAVSVGFAPPPALARPLALAVECFPSFVFPTAPPRGPPSRLI